MDTKSQKFTEWLNNEIGKRGWTIREAARRAGLSHGAISKVINGDRQPGEKFCWGIAQAFGELPEDVIAFARGEKNLLADREDMTFDELYNILKRLPPAERLEVYAYARYRYHRHISDSDDVAEAQSQQARSPADAK